MNKTVDVVRLLETNKAKVAFLAPVIAAVLATLASWVVSGEFNDNEIKTAASGVLLGLASGVGTFFANPGRAVVKD